MKAMRFGEGLHLVSQISPVDIVATDVDSPMMNISNCHWVTWLVHLGTITSDTLNITIEINDTNTTVSAVTANGYYRFTAAVGNDSYETAAGSTFDTLGVTITASDDDKILIIDYDPTENPDYNWVHLQLVTAGSMAACEVSVIAVLEQRYPQEYPISTT